MSAASEHSVTGEASREGRKGSVRQFFGDMLDGLQFARAMRVQAEQRSLSPSSLTDPQSWLMNAINGGPTKSGAKVNENTAFNVAAVRACVNFRANLIAMLPLKVFRKTPQGPEEQPDHPLAKLFRGRVSPAHTKFKWMHCSQVCFDMGGNAYSRVYRNAYAEVERIRWIRPCDVTPLENKQTGDTGFRVTQQGDLLQHDMLFFANLSTQGIIGRSPLMDLREAVGLSMIAEEFTARTFANGNRKPGIVEGGANMTTTKADTFIDWWQKNYAGASNAGKNPMIWGGFTWKDAGFSNDEAELLGMRKFSIEEIARVYQIPLHLVGSTDKSTTWGSGIEQLNQGLVDYMLAPLCTNHEGEMNTTLLTEQEQDQGFYIKFMVGALLRGSPETRAKVYQIMRGIAAMDVNQIRRLEEWTEYPDATSGDPRQPMNNQGGGGTQPAKQPIPAGDPANEE